MSIFKSSDNTGISKKAIAEIASLSALSCEGVAGMSAGALKGGLSGMLKRESALKGVDVSIPKSGGVSVVMHIIAEYGADMNETGGRVCSSVKEALEGAGIKTESVRTIIEGIRHSVISEQTAPPEKEEALLSLEGEELLEKIKSGFELVGIVTLKDGKFSGISEGSELTSDEDAAACALRLADMITSGRDIAVIAVYYGKNAERQTAESIVSSLSDKYGDADTEIHCACNMDYDYVIGVE